MRATPEARRRAGEITRQMLMPLAKQTTISCSVCSRLSATRAATKRDIGRISATSCGMARRLIFNSTRGFCP